MTKLLEIQENLIDTTAAISQLQKAIADDPSSPALKAMAMSLRKRQENLETAFMDEASSLGMHVCTYRLFGDTEHPTLMALTKALMEFQSLVTIIYDAVKRRIPKGRANVSVASRIESTFELEYSLADSMGFALTIPNERLLMIENNLDETIYTIFELAKAGEPFQVLEFARRLGPAPIRAMYRWALTHDQFGLGVDIEWRRGRDVLAKLFIQRPELQNLHRIIAETSTEKIGAKLK